MNFPNDKEITEFLNSLSDDDFVTILPENASNVDKLKYQLCQKFVAYLLENQLSQAELARQLNIDRSRVNWIIKYKIENFTIDRLYELLGLLLPELQLKVS